MMTQQERAYRRGALQAVQFLMEDLSGVDDSKLRERIAEWEQSLVAARDSEDVAYLGHFMDVVRGRVGGLGPRRSAEVERR